MSATATVSVMTTEELLAMPEDGVDRWLIRGQLREKPKVLHTRGHARTEASIAHLLLNWLDKQPKPRGEVSRENRVAGCAGIRTQRWVWT